MIEISGGQIVRMCGVTEALGGDGRFCRWPESALRYCIANQHPLVPQAVWEGEFEWALREVSSRFALDFERVDRKEEAHIVYQAGNLGGRGGTLGLTELVPCGVRRNNDFQSHLTIDALDRFSAEDQSRIAMAFDLGEVDLHELLHALGLGHITSPGVVALLNPTYNPSLSSLQPADVDAMVNLGYPLRVQPLPTPPTAPPTTGDQGRLLTTQLRPGQTFTAKTFSVVCSQPG